MKLFSFQFGQLEFQCHTIMGMLMGVELDDVHQWISFNLLIIKITIINHFLDYSAN